MLSRTVNCTLLPLNVPGHGVHVLPMRLNSTAPLGRLEALGRASVMFKGASCAQPLATKLT